MEGVENESIYVSENGGDVATVSRKILSFSSFDVKDYTQTKTLKKSVDWYSVYSSKYSDVRPSEQRFLVFMR